MKEALLIVDLQNDFLPGGKLPVPFGDLIVPTINQIQTFFSLIIATKDWHPPQHMSFASVHHKQPGEKIEVRGRDQELWPDHCIQGTTGAEFTPLLDKARIREIFFKGVDPTIDSYSAFYDNAHLRSTGLGDYLKQEGVTDIYIVGLATDYCVKYSVLDALKLGFKVHVVVGGCAAIDLKSGDGVRALQEMESAGAEIIYDFGLTISKRRSQAV